jgi:hypothetical protein
MDLADQICRYNDSFELKDKTKIPAVGYLSFENSSYEILDRLVKMRTNYNLSDCCSYDDYRRLMEQGAIIGDTKKQSIYDIWNSDTAWRIRKSLKDKTAFKFDPCKTCSSYESYAGYVPPKDS